MKKQHWISSLILLSLLIASCDRKSQEENISLRNQIEALKRENALLRSKKIEQDVTISHYNRTLEEIDYNLRTIDVNMLAIHSLKDKLERDVPVLERIKNRLTIIQGLIRNSNLKLHQLDQEMDELRRKNSQKSKAVLAVDRAVKQAAKVLINKEEEFNLQKLALDTEGVDLELLYEEQVQLTAELFKVVNRAFVLSGNEDELKDKKVLNQDGTFIGLAEAKILNANSGNTLFEQIEKDNKTSFHFVGENITLLTQHHEGSFTTKEVHDRLVLTLKDKKSFWRNGNYLVILIK